MKKCIVMTCVALAAVVGVLYILLDNVMCSDMRESEVNVKMAWREVTRAYEEKMDLVLSFSTALKKHHTDGSKKEMARIMELRAILGQVKAEFNELSNDQITARYQAYHQELSALLAIVSMRAQKDARLMDDHRISDLCQKLTRIEDRIKSASMRYNKAVEAHNDMLRNFPNNVANMVFLHLKPVVFLRVG